MHRTPDGHAWCLLHIDGQEGGILKFRGGMGPISTHGMQRTPQNPFLGCMDGCGQCRKKFCSALCAQGPRRMQRVPGWAGILKALGWWWDGGGAEARELLGDEPRHGQQGWRPTMRAAVQTGELDLLGSECTNFGRKGNKM